jgi:LemA protein
MKGGWVIVGVIALLVLGVGGWVVSNYNGLVTKKTAVEQSFAEVDNLLLRRNDLIPNLVETVKGLAAQEQAVFGQIAEARAQMAGARGTDQKLAAGGAMDSAIGRLLVVIENYPQLRSQENFLRLQDELAGTENRLSVSRTRYNEVVGEFNVMVRRFPTNLFAGMFGYKDEPFYEVTEEQKQVPSVQFPAAPGATAPEPAPATGN